MRGWHFLPESKQLGFYDGRTVRIGERLEMRPASGTPDPCVVGMHASRTVLDASRYERGPILCRVSVTGEIRQRSDKFCGRFRKVYWWVDAREVVKEALEPIVNGDMPVHPACRWNDNDIRTVLYRTAYGGRIREWHVAVTQGATGKTFEELAEEYHQRQTAKEQTDGK